MSLLHRLASMWRRAWQPSRDGGTMAQRLQRRQQVVAMLILGFVPPLSAAVAATLGGAQGPLALLAGSAILAWGGAWLAYVLTVRGWPSLTGHVLVASAFLFLWGLAYAAMFAHLFEAQPNGAALQAMATILHESLLFLTLIVLLVAALVGHPAMVWVTGTLNLVLAFAMRAVDADLFQVAFLFNNIAFTVLLVPAGLTVRRDREAVEENEDRLQRALADQRAALDGAPAAIWAFDEHGRVRVMNHLAESWFRQRTGAVPAVGDRPGPAQLPGGAHLIDLHRDSLKGKARRVHFREMQEQVRHLELATRPIRVGGQVLGTAFLLTDVTEREARLELEAAQQAHRSRVAHLEEMDRFKTRLLNTASHELNTPLTPMRLQVHVLRGDPEKRLDERQGRAVEMIERNLQRLETLVADILDVSRLESGTVRLETQRVDLAALVLDEVEGYAPLAAARGIAVKVQGEDHIWVDGDPRRLGQVVANLLSNAVKYAKSKIAVDCRVVGSHATLRVEDDGAGFEEEAAGRLFTPFGQLNPDDPEREGTGLGLYISKGLVEMHGGSISGSSEGAGKGAVFEVHLPVLGADP